MTAGGIIRRDVLALGMAMGAAALGGCAGIANPEAPAEAPTASPEDLVVEEIDSSGWDAQYYKPAYASSAEARAAAEEVARRIEAGGIVLLGNARDLLPLAQGTRVSLLGRSAVDTIFGGTGAAGIDTSACVSLSEGLAHAGLELNATTTDWISSVFENYPRGAVGQLDRPNTVSHYIGEIPWDDYPADVVESLAGTVGVVVLGRPGAEGDDLSFDLLADLENPEVEAFTPNRETEGYVADQHQLELTREEFSLIEGAKAACDAVVVLLNVATTMEVGPLVEAGGAHEADALVLIGFPGGVGAYAVGDVLAGAVNPSGRTTDTWAEDLTATPSFANFAARQYLDVDDHYTQLGSNAYFVEYAEGIYVGYRWFETAAEEGVIDYDSAVTFPFGYGLSYTTFEQTLDAVAFTPDDDARDGQVEARVTVTNTGERAGRDVVQLYHSAPWAPNGAQVSAVVLAAFAKTDELAPGESQELTLSWGLRDVASYDPAIHGWYREAGTNTVSLRANSHDVIDSWDEYVPERAYLTDDATGAPIENRFPDLDAYLEENVTLLSRADFAGTFPVMSADKTTSDAGIALEEYDPMAAANPADEMPTCGERTGLTLADLRGRDLDDPAWELLLDQLRPGQMERLVGGSVYGSDEIGSVGKPATVEPDGPAGFAYVYMTEQKDHAAFPSGYVQAQTWDAALMREMGEALGEEALQAGYSGWCAPALNCHRSPFGGRTFEYLSEDPLLAGLLAVGLVEGIGSRGVYAMLKHFCLNDKDSRRCWHLLTWAPEQAVREIYARPFELVVKRAKRTLPYLDATTGEMLEREMPGTTSVMSSYNYVGTTWAGGRESLVTGLLRDEWGFCGHVISDWSFYDYMEKNQAIYAGTDVNFTSVQATGEMVDAESPTAVNAMRRAMRRYLFSVANSCAMNGRAPTSRISAP